MTPAALLILAQEEYVERQVAALFCGQRLQRLREACLRSWRRPRCGC